MSHHKIVEVTATHVVVEGSPGGPGSEQIPKTDGWRACFGGTRRHGLGYYIRNANAPDGWASNDDIEAAVDPPVDPSDNVGAPADPGAKEDDPTGVR